MSDVVIKAENLGKKYVIGHQSDNHRYLALRDVIMNNTKTLWNKTKDLAKGKAIICGDELEEVWALKDVSFEIHRGEVVGIIGRNGAGKSTLLKILSRITEPSTGRVTIKGRVSSLLEVGTGFHPELTGRENIYLNGTILGMTRSEIKHKFDEIVAFAEVDKFLDTPVKRYSSGMYVRLAFAVAANLEPEILVVDEVLAVGDMAFQQKCLGKMNDVAKTQGRTVLFVSHNISSINALCSRVALLENGSVAVFGQTIATTDTYLVSYRKLTGRRWSDIPFQGIRFIGWAIVDDSGNETTAAYCGEYFCIEVIVENTNSQSEIALGISVEDSGCNRIFGGLSINDNSVFTIKKGKSKLKYFLRDLPLNEGLYFLTIALHIVPSNLIVDRIDQCMSFEVVNRGMRTAERVVNKSNGLIIVYPSWEQNAK